MSNLLALFLCWAPLLSALNFTAVFQRPEEVPVLHHDIPTIICFDEGEIQTTQALPLLVFGHGMLIFAEDYAYLCNDLPKLGFVVAMVNAETKSPQAFNMPGLAEDLSFIATAVQQFAIHNASSPLHQLLGKDSKLALFGHSAGASVTLEAAANQKTGPALSAIAGLAPRAEGYTKYATNLSMPALLMVGSEDCASTNGLAVSSLPLYNSMAANPTRILVVLEGGNHCNFTSPVLGTCTYDVCGSLSKQAQQSLAVRILGLFFGATLSKNAAPNASDLLRQLDQLADSGAISYMADWEGSSVVSKNFVNETCPCKGNFTLSRIDFPVSKDTLY
jgi:dienelactone hydrolase